VHAVQGGEGKRLTPATSLSRISKIIFALAAQAKVTLAMFG
jgi:hypothetical protein